MKRIVFSSLIIFIFLYCVNAQVSNNDLEDLTKQIKDVIKPNIFSKQVFISILPDNQMQRDELQLYTIVEKKLSSSVLEGKLELVSRAKQDILTEETLFQQGGSTVRENRVRLGRMLNIKYFIFINSQIVNKVATVGIDLIEIETGKILLTKLYNWNIKNSDSLYTNRLLPSGFVIETWVGGFFVKQIFTPVDPSGSWSHSSATGYYSPPGSFGIGFILPVLNKIRLNIRAGIQTSNVQYRFTQKEITTDIHCSHILPLHAESLVLFSLFDNYDAFGFDIALGLGIDCLEATWWGQNPMTISSQKIFSYSGAISLRPFINISNTLEISPTLDYYYGAPTSFNINSEDITIIGLNTLRLGLQLNWEI